jgi:hypothetical protein
MWSSSVILGLYGGSLLAPPLEDEGQGGELKQQDKQEKKHQRKTYETAQCELCSLEIGRGLRHGAVSINTRQCTTSPTEF